MAARTSLPAIQEVSDLPEKQQMEILDWLFEPSTSLHYECLPIIRKKAASWHSLIYDHIGQHLAGLHARSLDQGSSAALARATLDAILGSHPRLGAKKVDSVASSFEQAHLQSGSSEKENRQLEKLNLEYEGAFPGLRFVVFVNGRPRSDIMAIMRQRIEANDIEEERRLSSQAMLDIAWDRAQKLGAVPVHDNSA